MVGVPVQTGTSLGRQLVFFLFLLVPGYLAVRAYYWANIALENDARVNRLVLMAIGGFVSLVGVALWRQLVPTYRVSISIYSAVTLGYYNVELRTVARLFTYSCRFPETISITLVPKWLTFDDELSVQAISRLPILESLNLIASQSVIALVVGYSWGTLKYVGYDQRQPSHAGLERPWKQAVDRAGKGDPVEIVTTDGQRIVGTVEALGSPTREYDVLLADARPADGRADHRPDRVDEFMYFYHDDISRLVIQTGDISPGSTQLRDLHQKVTEWLNNRLPLILPDDDANGDPGKTFELSQSGDNE